MLIMMILYQVLYAKQIMMVIDRLADHVGHARPQPGGEGVVGDYKKQQNQDNGGSTLAVVRTTSYFLCSLFWDLLSVGSWALSCSHLGLVIPHNKG